jgi:hypothetical protein
VGCMSDDESQDRRVLSLFALREVNFGLCAKPNVELGDIRQFVSHVSRDFPAL